MKHFYLYVRHYCYYYLFFVNNHREHNNIIIVAVVVEHCFYFVRPCSADRFLELSIFLLHSPDIATSAINDHRTCVFVIIRDRSLRFSLFYRRDVVIGPETRVNASFPAACRHHEDYPVLIRRLLIRLVCFSCPAYTCDRPSVRRDPVVSSYERRPVRDGRTTTCLVVFANPVETRPTLPSAAATVRRAYYEFIAIVSLSSVNPVASGGEKIYIRPAINSALCGKNRTRRTCTISAYGRVFSCGRFLPELNIAAYPSVRRRSYG